MLVVFESYAAEATTIPTLVNSPLGYGCIASTVAWMMEAETLLTYSSTKPRSELSTCPKCQFRCERPNAMTDLDNIAFSID